jgi:hypothetical protein
MERRRIDLGDRGRGELLRDRLRGGRILESGLVYAGVGLDDGRPQLIVERREVPGELEVSVPEQSDAHDDERERRDRAVRGDVPHRRDVAAVHEVVLPQLEELPGAVDARCPRTLASAALHCSAGDSSVTAGAERVPGQLHH